MNDSEKILSSRYNRTHEMAEAVATFTRSAEVQVRWGPSSKKWKRMLGPNPKQEGFCN